MNIIIFGPQGSGKGTQADLLAKKFKLYHLSMGDELRKEIQSKTALGKKIAETVTSGRLVPDSVTNGIAKNISKSKDARHGIIFDGYPRRKGQWLFIKKNFKIDLAIELHIPQQESIKRISSRRVCPKCGKNYNTIWLKPKVADHCDADHSRLFLRDDDKSEEIIRRLKIYHRETEPLRKEYASLGIFKKINGSRPIDKVNNDVVKIINSL